MIGDAPARIPHSSIRYQRAIGRTYKRVGLRYANPVPTFSDLRDELAQWQDEEKMQRAVDEARLAAIKLRTWTDKGIYSRLFDRHTNIRTDNNWLFFNVEDWIGSSFGNRHEYADRECNAERAPEGAVGRALPCWMNAGHCSTRPSWPRKWFTVSNRAQTELQRLGHFADTRRLRWNLNTAASARSRHREERELRS